MERMPLRAWADLSAPWPFRSRSRTTSSCQSRERRLDATQRASFSVALCSRCSGWPGRLVRGNDVMVDPFPRGIHHELLGLLLAFEPLGRDGQIDRSPGALRRMRNRRHGRPLPVAHLLTCDLDVITTGRGEDLPLDHGVHLRATDVYRVSSVAG